MNKGKAARVAGFVGALGVSAVLVTTAIQGTGAWFTDSSGSNMAISSGHLTLLTKWEGQTNYGSNQTANDLNFNNLMPGTNVTHEVDYKADVSSGQADLWLVFDTNAAPITLPADPPPATTTKTGSPYQLFTGGGSGSDTGYGRYGYFAVHDSNGGDAFASGNLAFATSANDPSTNGDATHCVTNTAGRNGGNASNTWIYTGAQHDPGYYCGVPSKIQLATGLSSGQTGAVTITFGLNGPLQTWQNQPGPKVPFKLVLTQAGQRP